MTLKLNTTDSKYDLECIFAESEHQVKTKVVAIDFTEGVEIYEKIRNALQGLEVGILINNVGMAYPYPEYYLDMPNGDKLCQDMINCNVLSVTMMMRIVMPQMAERRRGVVVNMASLAAVAPTPLMCVYGASKVIYSITDFLVDLMHKLLLL